jgi:nucleotide-binding universal stress UspA family protein
MDLKHHVAPPKWRFVIGRSKPSRVTAFYVTSKSAEARRRRERGGWTTRRSEEAVLKGITQMAEDLYRTRIQTSIRIDVTAAEAILKEVASYDLVVAGVTRRPGDTLFFGNTAAAVLEKSDQPILFLGT